MSWTTRSTSSCRTRALQQALRCCPIHCAVWPQVLTVGGAGYDTVQGIIAALSPITVGPLDGVDITTQTEDTTDAFDMVDVSVEITSALDTPETVATGAVTIDYARGTTQKLILAANVPQLNVINWPGGNRTGRLILIITNTGNFAIAPNAWPLGSGGAPTFWTNDQPPVITLGAGKRDIIVLTSVTGAQEIYGSVVGQNYANA
jgi:hypothetical protein